MGDILFPDANEPLSHGIEIELKRASETQVAEAHDHLRQWLNGKVPASERAAILNSALEFAQTQMAEHLNQIGFVAGIEAIKFYKFKYERNLRCN